MFCAASFKNLWCEPGYIPLKDEKRCRELIILIKEGSIDTGSDYNRLFHLHVVSSRLRTTSTLGSRGYFFLIDTDGWRRSCVNEEKNNLWSQEYATLFPCEKSVQNLNWVTDWILPCPQGINNIIMALIGYIEQLDMGVSNR